MYLECVIYSYKTKSTKLDEKFQKCTKHTITANNKSRRYLWETLKLYDLKANDIYMNNMQNLKKNNEIK